MQTKIINITNERLKKILGRKCAFQMKRRRQQRNKFEKGKKSHINCRCCFLSWVDLFSPSLVLVIVAVFRCIAVVLYELRFRWGQPRQHMCAEFLAYVKRIRSMFSEKKNIYSPKWERSDVQWILYPKKKIASLCSGFCVSHWTFQVDGSSECIAADWCQTTQSL